MIDFPGVVTKTQDIRNAAVIKHLSASLRSWKGLYYCLMFVPLRPGRGLPQVVVRHSEWPTTQLMLFLLFLVGWGPRLVR